MSALSKGLENKQTRIESKSSVSHCTNCNGRGQISNGFIEVHNKGPMELLDDCSVCDASGHIDRPIRKIRRKSKVEVLC